MPKEQKITYDVRFTDEFAVRKKTPFTERRVILIRKQGFGKNTVSRSLAICTMAEILRIEDILDHSFPMHVRGDQIDTLGDILLGHLSVIRET